MTEQGYGFNIGENIGEEELARGRPRNLVEEGRDASTIINDAIKENNGSAQLLYVFSSIMLLLGVAMMSFGVFFKESIFTTIVGTIPTALFVPAMSMVRTIRRENQLIRLLEAPLTRAETAPQAAAMLYELMEKIFNGNK